MKVKLLKKSRNSIKLLNYHGMIASPTDKLITIKRFNPDGQVLNLITSKGKPAYINYGNALIRRRFEIKDVAKELNNKSKLWHIFHK